MTEFSIIMPVFNCEQYIRQALDSILNQSYPNYEVLLVDDGSNDSSGQICDEYTLHDERFKVIHQANAGVTVARKTGIKFATKEYIVWVDEDDFIGRNLLKQINDIVEEYKPDMVAFGYSAISNDGHIVFTKENRLPSEKLYMTNTDVFFNDMIYKRSDDFGNSGVIEVELWDKATKKDVLYDCLLSVPDELRIGEDMATVFTAIQRCQTIYVSNTCDYFHRIVDSSIMHTFKLDELKRHLVLFSYLSKNRGKIPQTNIDLYMFNEIMLHLSKAATVFDSYMPYANYAKSEMKPEIRAIIKRTKAPKCNIKQYLLFLMLKYNCFFGFWIVQRTKKNKK